MSMASVVPWIGLIGFRIKSGKQLLNFKFRLICKNQIIFYSIEKINLIIFIALESGIIPKLLNDFYLPADHDLTYWFN